MKLVTLGQLTPKIDDFSFVELTDPKTKDALVICNPYDALGFAPAYLRSTRSLEEHINYVQKNNIKKAMVVAENISFLRQCPSLEYLYIIPAFTAKEFDYSPLYDMPQIQWLQCDMLYGMDLEYCTHIDYSKIQGLESLFVCGSKGHENVKNVKGIKTLFLSEGQPAASNLEDAFEGSKLEKLSICQSPIRTLDGLEKAKKLRRLSLAHNRRLESISALTNVKDTLVSLDIESCGKIKDFSVLSELHNLENLRLIGTNVLPDLNFVQSMPNLNSIIFTMKVANGDISVCKGIEYVAFQERRHYSHKKSDFSKK